MAFGKDKNKDPEYEAWKRAQAETAKNAGTSSGKYLASLGVDVNSKAMQAMAPGMKAGETLVGGNMKQLGEERSSIRDRYKKLVEGPSMSEEVMGRKQNAAAKKLKAQQMAGGSANVGAQAQLDRQFASETAKASYDEYMSSLGQYDQSVRGAGSDIMKLGGQVGAVEVGMMKPPSQSSGGGGFSVVCTELHRRGLITTSKYVACGKFGRDTKAANLPLYIGYFFLGSFIAKAMKKSDTLTNLLLPSAISWTDYMAYGHSGLGKFFHKLLTPLCVLTGNLILLKGKYEKRIA